jgi:PAS domain S-box-containing protein
LAKNNESDLKKTLESLPLPAYVFYGAAHEFVAANRLFCELVGYSEAELKALPWPQILAYPADDVPAVAQLSESPALSVPITFRGRHKNGSVVIASVKYRDMRFVRDDGSVIDTFFSVVVGVEGEEARAVGEVFGASS